MQTTSLTIITAVFSFIHVEINGLMGFTIKRSSNAVRDDKIKATTRDLLTRPCGYKT